MGASPAPIPPAKGISSLWNPILKNIFMECMSRPPGHILEPGGHGIEARKKPEKEEPVRLKKPRVTNESSRWPGDKAWSFFTQRVQKSEIFRGRPPFFAQTTKPARLQYMAGRARQTHFENHSIFRMGFQRGSPLWRGGVEGPRPSTVSPLTPFSGRQYSARSRWPPVRSPQ